MEQLYTILKKPAFCYWHRYIPPEFQSYRGIDREPCVDALTLQGRFPEGLEEEDTAYPLLGIHGGSMKSITELYETYNPRKRRENELCMVSLDVKLSPRQKQSFTYLGIDLLPWGEGSLLLNGICSHSDTFKSFRDSINLHCLFDSDARIEEYMESYEYGQTHASVEPMIMERSNIKVVSMWRLNTQ